MIDKEAIELLAQSQAITSATEALAEGLDNSGLVTLPNDFGLHDIEAHMPNRRRPRGKMVTPVVEHFASYVRDRIQPGGAVFVDQEHMVAEAVLNLGTTAEPGHADNIAVYAPQRTAAFKSLEAHATGRSLTQLVVAEFLEDWAGAVECFNADGPIKAGNAIAAVRKITIESMRKQEHEERDLGVEASSFESVQAKSKEPIPTTIYFKCVPYNGLPERQFVLRLGILTGEKQPSIVLRIVKIEQHREEMAQELADKVNAALAAGEDTEAISVAIGTYTRR